MSTIVIGIDNSTGSQRALEWALEEASRRHATVRLVHALEPWPTYYPYSFLAEVARDEGVRREAEDITDKMLAAALDKAGRAPSDVTTEFVPRFGTPADVLIEEAKDADLLVVGSRGRGGFMGLVLGSVSHQVVAHARCPVVVIPPAG